MTKLLRLSPIYLRGKSTLPPGVRQEVQQVVAVNTFFPESGHLTLPTDDTKHYFLTVIIAFDCVEYYYEPAVDHHRLSRSGN